MTLFVAGELFVISSAIVGWKFRSSPNAESQILCFTALMPVLILRQMSSFSFFLILESLSRRHRLVSVLLLYVVGEVRPFSGGPCYEYTEGGRNSASSWKHDIIEVASTTDTWRIQKPGGKLRVLSTLQADLR